MCSNRVCCPIKYVLTIQGFRCVSALGGGLWVESSHDPGGNNYPSIFLKDSLRSWVKTCRTSRFKPAGILDFLKIVKNEGKMDYFD